MRIILRNNYSPHYFKQIAQWMPNHEEAKDFGKSLRAFSVSQPHLFAAALSLRKFNNLRSDIVLHELAPGKDISNHDQIFKEVSIPCPCSSITAAGFALGTSPGQCQCFPTTEKDGILILGAETGHVCNLNPSLVELLGSRCEEVIGCKFWRVNSFKNFVPVSAAFLPLQKKRQICCKGLPFETNAKPATMAKFRSTVYPPGHNQEIQCNHEKITLSDHASSWLQNAHTELERRVQERTVMLLESETSLEAEIKLRQRAEEAYLQTLRRLTDARENERRHLSRELHDQMSQELTALKLGLNSVHKEESLSSTGRQRLLHLEEMADVLMQKVHHLAWELRPPMLNGFGLELALRDYVTAWSSRSGVPVDYYDGDTKTHRMQPDLALILYRTAQEALTNVARHANASHVSVILECRGGCASLIVEDDGQGFDADKVLGSPRGHGRLGLLGMQERVVSIGGVIQIESTQGVGTTVYVRMRFDNKSVAGNQP